MPIFNQFKDTFDNLINSSDDGSDTKVPAELSQIYVLSNNILGP